MSGALRLRGLVWALFFASGAAGLAYEVIWIRLLSLSLSITVHALTTVLCAFMAGLALGSALASAVADRVRRPLVLVQGTRRIPPASRKRAAASSAASPLARRGEQAQADLARERARRDPEGDERGAGERAGPTAQRPGHAEGSG